MPQAEPLITGVDVRSYFQGMLADAVSRQSVPVQEETVVYLANLLAGYLRAECLFEPTPDGVMIPPLAGLYAEAASARSGADAARALQRLGDLSLFVSGLFAHSLARSLVDVDYYIAMGGNAYACLADSGHVASRRRALRAVFADLADRFAALVDVLAEVGERGGVAPANDVLREYEIWLATGSPRAAARLRRMGIEPVPALRSTH